MCVLECVFRRARHTNDVKNFSLCRSRFNECHLGCTSNQGDYTRCEKHFNSSETYSRIGLLRSNGSFQSYWTTTKIWKLTVVLDFYEAMETYGRIGLLRSYGNLQSYWNTTKIWKLTVVLEYYEDMETYGRIELLRSYVETYGRIGLLRSYGNLQSYSGKEFEDPFYLTYIEKNLISVENGLSTKIESMVLEFIKHCSDSLLAWRCECSTRFECSFAIFSTRVECNLTSSPLVSSVFCQVLF